MIMSEFPEDLVEEILCRVPATSFKRLQYTCKRWNHLLNDRIFTRKHLDKSPKQLLILMSAKCKVCSMNTNLYKIPHAKFTCEFSLSQMYARIGIKYVQIIEFFHCDGLLLSVAREKLNRLVVVWNPCTGQTKWIKILGIPERFDLTYTLGSHQENKSHYNSYKILRCSINTKVPSGERVFEIYKFNSNSWRTLDITLDRHIIIVPGGGVSLKGKTYWVARHCESGSLDVFLISFDYTTERLECLRLPYRYPSYLNMSISVFREEKLSVLIQSKSTSKTEIWVINKIDETKVVSWSMVVAVDYKCKSDIWDSVTFFLDEEKKVVLCCNHQCRNQTTVYIVGGENKVRHTDFQVQSSQPIWFSYVPSLTQF